MLCCPDRRICKEERVKFELFCSEAAGHCSNLDIIFINFVHRDLALIITLLMCIITKLGLHSNELFWRKPMICKPNTEKNDVKTPKQTWFQLHQRAYKESPTHYPTLSSTLSTHKMIRRSFEVSVVTKTPELAISSQQDLWSLARCCAHPVICGR